MKNILFIIICLLGILLCAQQTPGISTSGQSRQGSFDEKSILLKQAKRYSSRRDYEKANQILRELLEKYPNESDVVEDLLTNLMQMSEYDKAEALLADKKSVMPEYNYLRFQIPLLIRKGDTKAAFEAGDEYLAKNRTNINVYGDIARIFSGSRQFEQAADILERARKITKDDYQYTLDLARAYQSQDDNHRAATEYLKHLEKNKHYLHYVMNNLKGILNREPDVINTIRKFSDSVDNEQVTEAYALSLAYLDEYDLALLQYEKLESIKLLNFAEELSKMKKFAIALKAYDQYEMREDEPDLKAEAQLAKAEIYIRQHRYDLADGELQQIYHNKEITKGKYRYRTQAAKLARLLLADLAVRLDKPDSEVISYLTEAIDFANNQKEKKEIRFTVVDYRIKTGDLDTARHELAEILENEDTGTDIYKQSLYYTWQIALMQSDAQADSLLGELILNLPESRLTTDALYLTQIMTSLPEEFHQQLYAAWRLRGLYKIDDALALLNEIFEASGNDEIQLLAAEWQQLEAPESAQIWWQQEYENQLLKQYADLNLMESNVSDSSRYQMITSFLKANPQSIFAPRFRNELSRLQQRRD